MKKWAYESANFSGNLHEAARILSKHYPHWDVVALDYGDGNTTVVYREELTDPEPLVKKRGGKQK